ncbi:MAG: sodium:solute symporter family protein [Candidatus Marinimicrobia bacterium]|nr:sodium:solute symporter family protein [Candidatus Neomarinimicrobiota bacterium]
MHILDYLIFGIYFVIILLIGLYFYKKNKSREDYFVGGRSMSSSHIGMSIVATDVGGGFSIGLGGLGYVMGLSGSWLLFTGLVGAWLSAVYLVPKVKGLDVKFNMFTYPDFLRSKFNGKVALIAAIISGIGYLGFTGGQILAGAKLASATVLSGTDSLNTALYIIAGIIIAYTVLGGIKAVIYTDTVQWAILLIGLIFFAIPFAYFKVGGWETIYNSLPREYFTLTNISVNQLINWAVTIIPIWFIAMTLYQRIYASKNEKSAKKAFYIAGILEYPIMAFMGVILGMISKIFFPEVEAEMGLPLLLQNVLPIGVTGIVVASYFSAIMSTADSCLMASSGNIVNDIIERYFLKKSNQKLILKISQVATLIIGIIATLIASKFTTVLNIILQAYSFMIAGLFYPTLIAIFSKNKNSQSAFISMMAGGILSLVFIFTSFEPFGLSSSFYGILLSIIVYHTVSIFTGEKNV